MKRNFFISAIYTSPPTTMGGNTKIMIELINNLNDVYHFVIFTTEPETFKKNIKDFEKIEVIPISYPFTKFSYTSHYDEIKYISNKFVDYFKNHTLTEDDYFYSCSDFAPDVLPILNLKKYYSFKWIASLYLFIPTPFENILNSYQFPFVKYIIYYFYQRYLFQKMLRPADRFFITNDYDRKYFPKRMQQKLFAMYGGVNDEQIVAAISKDTPKVIYDAVFCSRLHPQKGINQLLDIWKDVVDTLPNAKLAVIGNGEKRYETILKQKAKEYKLEKNIKWFGYVNNIDKYEIYLQSKFLVHATVYDNNGMVAAEALSTGLPVILYDLPQLKDVYTDGCVKVPIRDKKAFTKTILRLLTDKEFYDSIKLNRGEVGKIRNFWKWKYRASLCLDFLQQR